MLINLNATLFWDNQVLSALKKSQSNNDDLESSTTSTHRMIRFPSTQKVDDPIGYFEASLCQSISYLSELVLLRQVDSWVAIAVGGIDVGAVDKQQLDLRRLSEFGRHMKWHSGAFLFVHEIRVSSLHQQAKRRFKIGRPDAGVELLAELGFETVGVVGLEVRLQHKLQVDVFCANELRLDGDRVLRVRLAFLLLRVGIQEDVLPHRIGTVSIDLIDVVQHRAVPAALPQSFDDRDVRSHRPVHRSAVRAQQNPWNEFTIRKIHRISRDYSPRLSEANGASRNDRKWKSSKSARNSTIPCSPQSPQVSTDPRDLARDIRTQL